VVGDEQESKSFDWAEAESAFAALPKNEQDEMLARLAGLRQPVEYRYQPETESAEVLELLIPERLEYLSALYEFLHGQLSAPGHSALFKGFSVIEVKGGFRGERVYYEPTLVVRLIYDRAQFLEEARDSENPETWTRRVDQRTNDLAQEIIKITQLQEEEIWIVRYGAMVAKYVRKEREP
jgi:hypothetical protein